MAGATVKSQNRRYQSCIPISRTPRVYNTTSPLCVQLSGTFDYQKISAPRNSAKGLCDFHRWFTYILHTYILNTGFFMVVSQSVVINAIVILQTGQTASRHIEGWKKNFRVQKQLVGSGQEKFMAWLEINMFVSWLTYVVFVKYVTKV